MEFELLFAANSSLELSKNQMDTSLNLLMRKIIQAVIKKKSIRSFKKKVWSETARTAKEALEEIL